MYDLLKDSADDFLQIFKVLYKFKKIEHENEKL